MYFVGEFGPLDRKPIECWKQKLMRYSPGILKAKTPERNADSRGLACKVL